ncbi:MAG: hypothetical protein OHK0052_18350 [Anaerolineales bacterium]
MKTLPIPDADSAARAALAAQAQRAQTLHSQRRARVLAFLHALGISAAASNSRNPLESPWTLTQSEYHRRAGKDAPAAVWESARAETAALTAQITALEEEINRHVAELYGVG